MLGAAMSLLLAFRLNVSYQRWWEARELWGDVLHASRSLLTHCLSHAPADGPVREVAGWAVGFAVALKHHLRGDLPDIIVLAAVASTAVRTVPRRTPSAARRLDALRASGRCSTRWRRRRRRRLRQLDRLYQLLTPRRSSTSRARRTRLVRRRTAARRRRAPSAAAAGRVAHAGTLAAVGAVDMMVRALTGCRILKTPCPPGYVGVLRAVVIIWLPLPFAAPSSTGRRSRCRRRSPSSSWPSKSSRFRSNPSASTPTTCRSSFCLTVQADALRLVDEARGAEGAEGEAARAGSPGRCRSAPRNKIIRDWVQTCTPYTRAPSGGRPTRPARLGSCCPRSFSPYPAVADEHLHLRVERGGGSFALSRSSLM